MINPHRESYRHRYYSFQMNNDVQRLLYDEHIQPNQGPEALLSVHVFTSNIDIEMYLTTVTDRIGNQ